MALNESQAWKCRVANLVDKFNYVYFGCTVVICIIARRTGTRYGERSFFGCGTEWTEDFDILSSPTFSNIPSWFSREFSKPNWATPLGQ